MFFVCSISIAYPSNQALGVVIQQENDHWIKAHLFCFLMLLLASVISTVYPSNSPGLWPLACSNPFVPFSTFLTLSFLVLLSFRRSPSFFWRVRVLGAVPWGPWLAKVHHPGSGLWSLIGSKSHLGLIFSIFGTSWKVANFRIDFGVHFSRYFSIL